MELQVRDDNAVVPYVRLDGEAENIAMLFPVIMGANNITGLPGDFINVETTVTAVAGDFVLIRDATDGNLKKADVNDFLGGGEVFTWTADHDTGGFALTFTSDTTDPAGTVAYLNWDAVNMQFNVPTADGFAFRFNGTNQYVMGPAEFNTGGLVVNTGGGDLILLGAGTHLISADTGGIEYRIPSGDTHDFFVNNLSQMTISETTIDFQANTLTDIADITSITNLNGVAIGNYILTTDSSTSLADTANIVYNNQANTFGDFVQTFKDNAIHIENPAGTFDVVLQTSAEVTSDRILTIPLLGGNRTMTVTGLADQLTNTELTSGVFAKITGVGVQSQDLEMGGNNIQNAGVMFMAGQATADADVVDEGQFWVQDLTGETAAMFTGETGDDWALNVHRDIVFVIDGGGAAITTGIKGVTVVDYDCTVVGWTIIGEPDGAIVVDVNRSTFAGYPTTASIAGTELPTITATNDTGQDTNLTSWSTINAGDIIEFEVDSITTIQRCTVVLKVRPTGQ
jgi:hypothetical protein